MVAKKKPSLYFCDQCNSRSGFKTERGLKQHKTKMHPSNGAGAIEHELGNMKIKDCRCRACSRLLFRARLTYGSKIEARCPRCGRMSIFEVKERIYESSRIS